MFSWSVECQVNIPPFDSRMNTLTSLMREFPSLEAVPEVPDDSFGEFQEVRLQAVPAVPQLAVSQVVLSAKEREEIVRELLGRDISTVVLTPLQREAIIQEKRARQRGFAPFSPASDTQSLPSQHTATRDSDFNTVRTQNLIEENRVLKKFPSQQGPGLLQEKQNPFKRPALTFLPTEEPVKRKNIRNQRRKNIRIKLKDQHKDKISNISPNQQVKIPTKINIDQANFQTNFETHTLRPQSITFQQEQERFNRIPQQQTLPSSTFSANPSRVPDSKQPRRLNHNSKQPLPPVESISKPRPLSARQSVETLNKLPRIPQQVQEPPASEGSHPEQFLNKLSPADQQKFLSQFSVLNQEQQTYAYNQFLSTPPEVQIHAINQFLSLDPEVLIVSIQAEIDSQQNKQQPHGNPPPNGPPTTPSSNQNLPKLERAQQSRKPNRPRQSEREAFHRQLQLQKLQQEQLKEIIKQQHSINSQGQTIIM